MKTCFHGIFFVKFLLNLILKTFLSSFEIKFACNTPEISTLQKIKNIKPPGIKYQKTEIQHGSTFCGTLQFSLGNFYRKRTSGTKVLRNFGIFCQKFTRGCSLELSPILETKIPL